MPGVWSGLTGVGGYDMAGGPTRVGGGGRCRVRKLLLKASAARKIEMFLKKLRPTPNKQLAFLHSNLKLSRASQIISVANTYRQYGTLEGPAAVEAQPRDSSEYGRYSLTEYGQVRPSTRICPQPTTPPHGEVQLQSSRIGPCSHVKCLIAIFATPCAISLVAGYSPPKEEMRERPGCKSRMAHK